MLTDTELPGFPYEDETPICLDCELDLFANPNRWTEYTDDELRNWENTIPLYGAPENAVFQDPKGNVGNHSEICTYYGVPPIALWQRNPRIANRVLARILQAKQSSPPSSP